MRLNMAKDGQAMSTRRTKQMNKRRAPPEWPADRRIPESVSAEEGTLFWGSYSFSKIMEAEVRSWCIGQDGAKAREHVYRVRGGAGHGVILWFPLPSFAQVALEY
jgi:hypothetical protein